MRRRKKRPTHVGTFMSGMNPILRNHHLDNVQSWERLSGYLKKKTLESFRFQLKCWVICRDRCCCRAFRFWITNYLMKSRVWGVINSFQWNANRREILWMNERRRVGRRPTSPKQTRSGDKSESLWMKVLCLPLERGDKGSGRSGRRAGILDHKNNLFLIKKIFLLLFVLLRSFLELDERPFLAGSFKQKSIVLRRLLLSRFGWKWMCTREGTETRNDRDIGAWQHAQTLGKSYLRFNYDW